MKLFATLFVLLILFAAVGSADCGPGMHPVPTGDVVCYFDFAGNFVCYQNYECVPNEGCYDPTPGICAPPIWLPQAIADRPKLPAIMIPQRRWPS